MVLSNTANILFIHQTVILVYIYLYLLNKLIDISIMIDIIIAIIKYYIIKINYSMLYIYMLYLFTAFTFYPNILCSNMKY